MTTPYVTLENLQPQDNGFYVDLVIHVAGNEAGSLDGQLVFDADTSWVAYSSGLMDLAIASSFGLNLTPNYGTGSLAISGAGSLTQDVAITLQFNTTTPSDSFNVSFVDVALGLVQADQTITPVEVADASLVEAGDGGAVNAAPVVEPVVLSTVQEDADPITLSAEQLLGGASDADGDSLSVSDVALVNAEAGSLSDNGDGSYTLTLADNFNGEVAIDYKVSDGVNDPVAASATLAVQAVNDIPVADPVVLPAVAEGSAPITLTAEQLLGGASDVDGDALNLSDVALVNAEAGTLADNGDGTYTLTLAAEFNGEVEIGYQVTDGLSAPVATSATLAVEAATVDQAPYVTLENLQAQDNGFYVDLVIHVSGNEVGSLDGQLVFGGDTSWVAYSSGLMDLAIASSFGLNLTPNYGTGSLAISGAGSLTQDVTITLQFNTTTPSDSFNVSFVDAALGLVQADQTITPVEVADASLVDGGDGGAVNAAPVVELVVLSAVLEDADPITLSAEQLLGGASDADGDSLSVSDVVLVNAEAGDLSDNGDGTYTLTLADNFNGEVAIGYKVSDGHNDPVAATATLAVQAVNDAPVAEPVELAPVDEDSAPLTITAAELLGGASDVDGDTLSVSDVALVNAEAGSLSDNGDGSYTLTLAADFNGEVEIGYQINDGHGEPVAATATLAVAAMEDGASGIALSGSYIDENTAGAVIGALSVADADGGDYQFSLSDERFEVVDGQLKLKDEAALDFEAEQGSVAVTVTATDPLDGQNSTSETFTLEIGDLNDAPTALELSGDGVAENAAGALIGSLIVTDQDIADAHSFNLSDERLEVVDGQLKLKAGQALDFETDGPSFEVQITATDSQGEAVSTSATVVVNNVNEAPSGLGLSNNAIVGGRPGLEIGTLSISDPEFDTVTYSLSGADADKLEILDGVLKLKDDVAVFSRGDDLAVTVTATDSGGLATSAGFSIAVTPEIEVTVTDDVLSADAAHANLSGMGGDDTLIGDAADNVLIGGRHNDLLFGGEGHDVAAYTGNAHEYVISLLSAREVDLFNRFAAMDGAAFDTDQAVLSVYDSVPGEDGSDRVQVETLQFADVSYSVNGYELVLSDQVDNFQGGFGNDWVRGGGGNDTIKGGRGSDLLVADAGMDQLDGESGDDVLVSLQGRNTLLGGSGDDILVVANSDAQEVSAYGNSGVDTFVLSNQAGELLDVDLVIADFKAGEDKLDLSALRDSAGGTLEFSDLAITENGNLVLIDLDGLQLADGSGTVSGSVEMYLDGPTAFSATDVVFSGGAAVTDLLETINDNYVA